MYSSSKFLFVSAEFEDNRLADKPEDCLACLGLSIWINLVPGNWINWDNTSGLSSVVLEDPDEYDDGLLAGWYWGDW